jgi:PAS domain S-box-containing protein
MMPDIKTLMLLYLIINIINTGAVAVIWRQNRGRSGISFWLIGLALQAAGPLLLVLRGLIPDLISMTGSNTVVLAGILIIFMGLERFTGVKGRQIHNYFLLAVFVAVSAYFVLVQPDLMARDIAVAAMIMIYTFQCCWLLLRRVAPGLRQITRITGIVFAGYVALSFVRIILTIIIPEQSNDFFNSGVVNSLAITGYILLNICLIISLVLMVNRRLLADVKTQEAALRESDIRFRELFNHMSSGVAMYEAIDNGGDFIFRDFNPSAEKIEKVSRKDVLGKRVSEAFPGVKTFGIFEVFQRVWQTGKPEYFPENIYTDEKDRGSWRETWVFKLPTGEIIAVYNDITGRRRGEEVLRESEERYRSILEQMYDHYYEVDLAGNFTFVNESTCRNLGYSREELIGKSYRLTVPEVDIKGLFAASKAVFKSGEPNKCYSHSVLRKDGSILFAESFIGLRRNKQGEIIGFRTVSRDVTEHKQAEETLRESEARFRKISALTNDISYSCSTDKEGGFAIGWMAGATVQITGYTIDEIKAQSCWRFLVVEEDIPLFEEHVIGLSPGQSASCQLRIRRKDGTIRWLDSHAECITETEADGRLKLYAGLVDITGRKQLEEKTLKQSTVLYAINRVFAETLRCDSDVEVASVCLSVAQELSDSKFGWVGEVNIAGHLDTIALSNPGWASCRMPESQATKMIVDMQIRGIWGRVLKDGKSLITNNPVSHPDSVGLPPGHPELTSFLGVPLKHAGQTIGMIALANKPGGYDIHDQEAIEALSVAFEEALRIKRAEEALRKSEEQFRAILEQMYDPYYEVDLAGNFTFVNESTCRHLGYAREELVGKSFSFIVPADEKRAMFIAFNSVFKSGEPNKGYPHRIISKDGRILFAESSIDIRMNRQGETVGFKSVSRDVTDRRRLEEEQQRVAKLESVGLLAGGIAHDFNNILTSILGNISLASMEAAPGSELQNSLEQAEKASLRAKDLTKQLLTFSKGGAPVTKLTSLMELLKDTAVFALRGSNVKCHFSLPADLWHAEIDAGQVSQVVHNLVINAQQSMPTGGTVEILAENIALSKTQSLGKGLPLTAGNYVRIAVADHGTGIPRDHLEKIFDPFFSTKQQGSGLGLATSFSIARQHGGHLSVESELGSGSTFYLYLPASTQTSAPKQAKKEAIKPVGKARILVMDDEKGVREVAGRMLRHIGYKDIEFAADGVAAIKLYKAALKSGHPFNVAILDLTIAGSMGGEETVNKLLKIDPGVKAIVSSGYADDPVIAKYKEHGFSGMVAKPYTIAELRKAVRDVIG